LAHGLTTGIEYQWPSWVVTSSTYYTQQHAHASLERLGVHNPESVLY